MPDGGETLSGSIDAGAQAIYSLLNPEAGTEREGEADSTEETVETEEQEAGEPLESGEAGESSEETEDSEDAEATEEEGEETSTPAELDEDKLLVKVKVDGTEETVNLTELKAGYSRQRDYTIKTQKLAEERKAFSAEVAQVQAERQRYATLLVQLEESLQVPEISAEEWEQMKQADPARAAVVAEEVRRVKEDKARVAAERQRIEAEFQRQVAAQQAAYIEAEMERLVTVVPEWKDEVKRNEELGKLAKFALDLGFTPDEVRQVTDHRTILLLRKAAAYDAAQKQKPAKEQKVREIIKAAKPGAPKGVKTKASRASEIRERLRKSGSAKDAADYFIASGLVSTSD